MGWVKSCLKAEFNAFHPFKLSEAFPWISMSNSKNNHLMIIGDIGSEELEMARFDSRQEHFGNKHWSAVWKLIALTWNLKENPIGLGLSWAIEASQIFQLHQAVKICAAGLYNSVSFLSPHWKHGCTHLGWISSHQEQSHPSYCFAVLQTGRAALNTTELIKVFGQSHNVSNKSK